MSAPEPSGKAYSVSFVLPCYNEEANIERAIDEVTRVAERLCAEHEIIVVDDGSADGSVALVQRCAETDPRVRLVQHEGNRGYGEALRSGFTSAELDLVFFTDSDNQFVLDELERFLPWIDHVHVVAGYRANRQDPPARRLMARGWNYLVRVLFYVPVRDIDCAFKLFRRSVFEELDLEAVGAMVSTELMVKVGRSGFGVVEIPVTHLPRTAGEARGADPRVILRAFRELRSMRRRLQVASGATKPRPVRV